MSKENVEIARRAVDAYNRRDLATLRDLGHADIELDWSASAGPDASVYSGIDAVIRFGLRYGGADGRCEL